MAVTGVATPELTVLRFAGVKICDMKRSAMVHAEMHIVLQTTTPGKGVPEAFVLSCRLATLAEALYVFAVRAED